MVLKFAGKDHPDQARSRSRGRARSQLKQRPHQGKARLGSPSVKLQDGLKVTFDWMCSKFDSEAAEGIDNSVAFAKSTICSTQAPTKLGQLRAADGEENLVP